MKQDDAGLSGLEQYILLPGRSHGDYSYPDLLVGKHLLRFDAAIQWVRPHHRVELMNRALENGSGRLCISELSWESAIQLNLLLGGLTLTPIQFSHFLKILSSSKAFDGDGKRIPRGEISEIYQRIILLDEEYHHISPSTSAGEWLDARIIKDNNEMRVSYAHRLVNSFAVPNFGESSRDLIHRVNSSLPQDGIEAIRVWEKRLELEPKYSLSLDEHSAQVNLKKEFERKNSPFKGLGMLTDEPKIGDGAKFNAGRLPKIVNKASCIYEHSPSICFDGFRSHCGIRHVRIKD